MSLDTYFGDNVVVLIIEEGNVRFGEFARVLRHFEEVNGESEKVDEGYIIEFADNQRYAIPTQEIGYVTYIRSCESFAQSEKAIELGRDLHSLRDAYCGINEVGNNEFVRAFTDLFYRFQKRSEQDLKYPRLLHRKLYLDSYMVEPHASHI